jgi:hypothetical protein
MYKNMPRLIPIRIIRIQDYKTIIQPKLSSLFEQKTVILTTDLGHKMSTSFISFRKSSFFEQVLNING